VKLESEVKGNFHASFGEKGAETRSPQGGKVRRAFTPLSPLLANIYLNYLDRVWTKQCRQLGVLVRYADDLVILCRNERDAREALRRLKIIMEQLGVKLHPDKTCLVDLREGREGFDFLGFHHRKVRHRFIKPKIGQRSIYTFSAMLP
jgi:RNA-directed DNA polymerase